MKFSAFLLTGFLIAIPSFLFSQIVLRTPGTDSQLYVGNGNHQPLVVGLGGSEGGNAWASNHWKQTRDAFIEKGYAFLAIGYFGMAGTPDKLDRISIENIHNAILEATANPRIDKNKIAVIGGSRGGDLALLLGSYFKDITCAVAIVASNVSFPGNTDHFTTSSWTYDGKELPFVPVNEAAIPFLMKGDLRPAFEAMLTDSGAQEKALIKVERINGPVLLLSATKDEICPSTPMAEKMMTKLKDKKFAHTYQHIAVDGSHAEPLKYFNSVFSFLAKEFPAD